MQKLNEENFNTFLNNIQKQFLCCYPLHCILWQDFPKNLSWAQQKTLMDYTLYSSLNTQFPIKISYQLNFLKKLLSILESNFSEVHDIVYETYCRMQQNLTRDSVSKYAFKHYIIKSGMHLTLRESKSFVDEGTTGLCSWQASLALADFFIKNPSVVRDKIILELGAGTGLCGLTILKVCQPRYLLLSDGSSSCVELIRESVKRNFPQALEVNHKFEINTQIVECSVVPWKYIKYKAEIIALQADVLIAADVVYDYSCFKDLSSAIDYVFKLKEDKVQMYLAATVRDENTLKQFMDIIRSLCFKISECDVVPFEESHLYWDRSTSVKILKLSR